MAGPGIDLTLATRSISPTVIIASAETLADIHHAGATNSKNTLQKFAHVSQLQMLRAGQLSTDTVLSKMFGARAGAVGATPAKLRLIFVSERIDGGTPELTASMLNDLRVFTRARICYALTASKVAGAVAQTNMYDYRGDDRPGHGHFGVPVSSVEIKLVSPRDSELAGNTPRGEIVVTGPAVAGEEARLGAQGTFRDDCTLAYA